MIAIDGFVDRIAGMKHGEANDGPCLVKQPSQYYVG